MIKFIKPRKNNRINLYAISARKGYKEIVQDSVDSLYIKFKVLGYGVIISGWHLFVPMGVLTLLSIFISSNLRDIYHLTLIEYILVDIGISVATVVLIKLSFDIINLIGNIKFIRR